MGCLLFIILALKIFKHSKNITSNKNIFKCQKHLYNRYGKKGKTEFVKKTLYLLTIPSLNKGENKNWKILLSGNVPYVRWLEKLLHDIQDNLFIVFIDGVFRSGGEPRRELNAKKRREEDPIFPHSGVNPTKLSFFRFSNFRC